MTRFKGSYDRHGYSYSDCVFGYMNSNDIQPIDELLVMSPKVDKQSEAVMSQLLAQSWGLA
jgi:hypothetical protein